MTIVYLIFFSFISAILYRLGGASAEDQANEFPWIPEFLRRIPKKRDVGCTLIAMAGCSLVGLSAPWWAWLLSFGLSWGALSTYWDELFGYDNHYAHGFGVGLALMPLMPFGHPLALFVRALLLGLAMGIWSEDHGNATIEELGRGFAIPLTLIPLAFL